MKSVFSHFGSFWGGGGKNKFCGQTFYGHPDFLRQREKGQFEANPLKMAIFPVSLRKNRTPQGVENGGSLISAPLALRALHVGVAFNDRELVKTEVLEKRVFWFVLCGLLKPCRRSQNEIRKCKVFPSIGEDLHSHEC